jgi:hypothetical protein
MKRGCRLSAGKVSSTHPVGAICNHNLGVFTVTKIAMENTGAVSPAHPVPRTKGGLSGVAKVPRAERAVDLPCAADRLAIAVYRTC